MKTCKDQGYHEDLLQNLQRLHEDLLRICFFGFGGNLTPKVHGVDSFIIYYLVFVCICLVVCNSKPIPVSLKKHK